MIKNKLQAIALIIFLLLTNSIYSQTNRLNNSSVYFDYAKFKNDSNSVFVEFYYGIILNSLTPYKENNDSIVAATIDISIYDDSSKQKILDKPLKIVSLIQPDIENKESKYITGIKSFLLKSGNYKFKISVTDLKDTLNYFRNEFNIKVSPFESEKLSISSLEICSNIIEGSENKDGYFYKNTYEVVPNPSLIFGEGLPVVFYYLEVYNLLKGEIKNPVIITVVIRDNQGKIKLQKQKPLTRKFNSIVEVGAFNISKLVSGGYQLAASVIDTITGNGMVSTKKFFIYNSSIKDTTPMVRGNENYLSSEFAVMGEEEIAEKFACSKYIATSDEINQWEKLTSLEGKSQFLYKFWFFRNPDQSSSRNEFKDGYFERVSIANQRYSSNKTPGWKTDRGRVLLIYGEPSEIERFPNEMDSYPYEIWHFNQLEGGSIFIFGDLTGISQMSLIHSTYRGELRDDNWFNRLKRSR